ncbi:MAG: hypothetical protein MJZ34_04935 [Paludibacteraceae bacterium]|nr:hypothetical protein [Paludibacteraceae bacterium]
MDFLTYLKESIAEETKGQPFADELARAEANAQNNSLNALLKRYFAKGGSAKVSLKGFGDDLADALVDYFKNELVKPEDFATEDKYGQYIKVIRNDLEEKLLPDLASRLEQLGIKVDNLKNTLTK